MDRQKYATNEDYRQGYDEGLKDGKNQVITEVKTHVEFFNTCFNLVKSCVEEENENVSMP